MTAPADPAATLLNHVAMSMPLAELDASSDEILAFYGEVFGWTGYRDVESEGAPLVILLGGGRQFVFVYGGLEATSTRPMDHYGVEVPTEEALDAILERARRLQARDPRVHVVDKGVTAAGPVDVVQCYIGFVLPLMVEVQHFRPAAGSRAEPAERDHEDSGAQ